MKARLKSPASHKAKLGWELLSQRPPLFAYFFSLAKTYVTYWTSRSYLTGVAAAELRRYLSNMDVTKSLKESNRFFCDIENFAYGEINERGFSNPRPRVVQSIVR